MPLFSRNPAMVVLESGEVAAVLSECSQRVRGQSWLLDPVSRERTIVCRETPQRNERLGWLFRTSENRPFANPTITPIFVLENHAKDGANPKEAHYLRDAQGLDLTYFPTTKEVTVFFWWNLYSPLDSVPVQAVCVSTPLVPTTASTSGDWSTYEDPDGETLDAINKPVNQVMTFPPPKGPNDLPVAGLFGRSGALTVTLGVDPDRDPPAQGMTWKGVLARIVLARREVPNSIRESLNLPLSTSSESDAGDDPLNGPYRDGNPQAKVLIKGFAAIGSEIQSFSWEFGAAKNDPYTLQVPSHQDGTNSLIIYSANIDFQDSHTEQTITLEFNVYIDNMYTPVSKATSDGFTSIYVASVDATLQCSAKQEESIDIFYNTYKQTPITFTLPLNDYEPHAFQRTTENVDFDFSVGDPPLDPGGGWAGIYNRTNKNSLLSVAGASPGKDTDPFQFTDDHKHFPPDPGYVTYDAVQREGELINLGSIQDSMNTYTQHLYHQREIQASRMGTRVLMMAKGQIQDLVLLENPPDIDDTVIPQFGGLTIGLSQLTPAIVNNEYQGPNTVYLVDSNAIFPFGVSLPGFATSTPGDIGHQFRVSGGTPPYQWCLRRTRSSQIDPARVPDREGMETPPYPFDDYGELIPGVDFPPATRSGGMPPGMLFDTFGVFYGTPTQTGSYIFRIHVRDSTGLHGEATVLFFVMDDLYYDTPDGMPPAPCSENRTTPMTFKTTITRTVMPSIQDDKDSIDMWRGRVEATGGQTGNYLFVFPNPIDPPWEMVPASKNLNLLEMGVTTGDITINGLTTDNFDEFRGVWLFGVQVIESVPPGVYPTCDIRGLSLSIGTTNVAGMEDQVASEISTIPEGAYQKKAPMRSYLVLNPPVIAKTFIQGKNTYLRGNVPYPLRPDLGGININPGVVTSIMPGMTNPVQVIGIGIESAAPSFNFLDWQRSNPVAYFRNIVDRHFPVSVTPLPPAPPGIPTTPVSGSSIDEMIPVGKRIRPLWPV
jgi:hypothetical protein